MDKSSRVPSFIVSLHTAAVGNDAALAHARGVVGVGPMARASIRPRPWKTDRRRSGAPRTGWGRR